MFGAKISIRGSLTAPTDDKAFIAGVKQRTTDFLTAWASSGQPSLPLVELLRDTLDAVDRAYLLGKVDREAEIKAAMGWPDKVEGG